MSKKARALIFVVFIAAVIAVALLAQKGIFSGGESAKTEQADKEDKRFKPAERGDIRVTIKATGLIEPKSRVRIKSEASGRIENLYIKEGDEVKPGDLIAKLDQTNQKINLRRAELTERLRKVQLEQVKGSSNKATLVSLKSNVDTAKLALDQAELYYGRVKELHSKDYATSQELDEAGRRRDEAKLALSQAEAQLAIQSEEKTAEDVKAAEIAWQLSKVDLDDARKGLGDATIICPISGTVLMKNVEEGDTVVSSTGVFGEGTTICEIADLAEVQIRASVDEIDIGRVEKGQKVVVEVDAYPMEKFDGLVANIFQQGASAGGITSFTVIIEVDNADRRLLSAMTANVEIVAQTVENAIVVPYDVVRTDDELGTIVYVKGTDARGRVKPEKRKVKLGSTDYEHTEIMEGIEEGELVMVENVPQATTTRFGGEVKIE